MQNLKDQNERFGEELASEVVADFERRRADRRLLESGWRLNLEFVSGRQRGVISPNGEVEEWEGGYFWQSRNSFNHVGPIIEARLSKLSKVRPTMTVRAATSSAEDGYAASVSSKILRGTCDRLKMDELISSATRWSEITGTAFYKIGWDGGKGKYLGENEGVGVYEGDVSVEVISPFEIFPDSLSRERISDCESVIRARVVSAASVKECYGVEIPDGEVEGFSADYGEVKTKGVLLIERYEKPTRDFPLGRIVSVAGGVLVRVEELPYVNGEDGSRDYPFIRQTSSVLPGRFFGSSVVERLIPAQRAYNAVRNRKQELLNRITMGVLTCEDGACDVDSLVEEGLEPGRIIVYRQGSEPPKTMGVESLPADFDREEERLLDEFVLLGGVNEVSQNYKTMLGVTSATGLQILLEQEEERMTVCAENVRHAVKQAAKHILRLLKQFTEGLRLMRVAGESGNAELIYFSASDLSGDDVIFETDNELAYSPSQRRSNILSLISSGLLAGEDGKISMATKAKLLDLMGFRGLIAENENLEAEISAKEE